MFNERYYGGKCVNFNLRKPNLTDLLNFRCTAAVICSTRTAVLHSGVEQRVSIQFVNELRLMWKLKFSNFRNEKMKSRKLFKRIESYSNLLIILSLHYDGVTQGCNARKVITEVYTIHIFCTAVYCLWAVM